MIQNLICDASNIVIIPEFNTNQLFGYKHYKIVLNMLRILNKCIKKKKTIEEI